MNKTYLLLFTMIVSTATFAGSENEYFQQGQIRMLIQQQLYIERNKEQKNKNNLDGNKSDTLTEEITFVVEDQGREVKN